MIGDLHIHSKYSFDSKMEPREILKRCQKLGMDMISITDHDSIKGSFCAKNYEKEFNISIIVGEEVKTDLGDIIGLNLNEEIKSRNWREVLEEIKSQGGTTMFPHPYRGHQNIEQIAEKVDIIEVFNSRSRKEANNKAAKLALKFKKIPVMGSDAHVYSELGNVIMNGRNIFDPDKTCKTKYSNKRQKVESYIIKDLKLKRYQHIPYDLARLII